MHTPRTIRRVALFVLTLCATSLCPSITAAQDRPVDQVVLQPAASTSRIVHTCVVVDFTGEKITTRNRQSTQIHTYDASEVVEVRTSQTPRHIKGLESFARGDLEQAASFFEQAMVDESRNWVRRDILAMLIRCALRRGDHITAGSKFLALWQSDPTTPHFNLIPLAWAPTHLTDALRNESLGWLALGNEASRLLGASYLLTDDRHQARAKDELGELASSIKLRIRSLARAQLWRLQVREGNIIPAELKRWQLRIEAMPQEIRGGPYYVLGRGYLVRREFDRAAAAMLWVPLVYDDQTYLAARACLDAADALRKVGQQRDAMALYGEVATRFAATPFADEAAAILKEQENNKQESTQRGN